MAAETPPTNLETYTLGGKQFWADVLCFHQWRIQRSVVTEHYRLLDEHDVRYAWGTFDHCRERLDEIKRERKLAPMSGRVVLALHGMFRNRSAFARLRERIEAHGGCQVLCLNYPSTRGSIADYAKSLASVVENLHGVERIDFVAHSLGNLVVRHYLADVLAADTRRAVDKRITRMVMLGPPNHAPQRAKLWTDSAWGSGLYFMALPHTGRELTHDWEKLEAGMATPPFEFGILAGGRGNNDGWHSGLEGDDDGTVTVAETRLAGAHDFLVVPVRHTFLPSDDRCIELVQRFLDHGYFVDAEHRQPIDE
jgi:pimeloyl-ACP methyl ester carboxylesterase